MLSPFAFMVLVGLGTYVPYVAFHTTIFERLIAVFHERGNIGYLMYLADAFGYLTYMIVMVAKSILGDNVNFLPLFKNCTFWLSIGSMIIVAVLAVSYARRIPKTAELSATPDPAGEMP